MRGEGSASSVADSLLERERELAQFVGLLEQARAGRGGLLVVEGPPGIGKTRLLEAGRAAAAAEEMAVLGARASELDREFPFGVVRQLFEPVVVRADDAERARLLMGAAGLAGSLLRGWGAASALEATTDQSLMLFHALYWLTVNLSDSQSVLMVIDDAHWADSASLRFVQFVLPRLHDLPVLFAIGVRTGEVDATRYGFDAVATDALSQVLRLKPLSPDAVQLLVAETLTQAVDHAFSAACHEATGGNPLLLRELLRELETEGIEPTAAGAPLVRQLGPSTVARAVLLRLARLGDRPARLARAVAVLGDNVPLRRACALAGVDADGGQAVARALSRAGILAAERPLNFMHPILRAAVYGELDPGERSVLHHRASELLIAEEAQADAIAPHLLAAEPQNDYRVVRILRDAAGSARSRGATETAVLCLRRTLTEPPPARDRAQLLLELASAELRAGDPASADEHFREGARASSDPRLRAKFAWDHALALQALGRHEEAFELRQRAAEDVRGADSDLAFSLEASLLATARLELRRLEWTRARLQRYLAEAALPEGAEQRMRVTRSQLSAFSRDSRESARGLAEIAGRALASGQLIDGNLRPATPFFSAVELLTLADRPDEARRALDELVEEAQRRGSAPGFAFACGWRCLVLAREGSLVEAEADARSCAELSLAQGWFRLGPLTLGYILEALIERAQLRDAHRILESSGMAEQTAGDNVVFDPMIHARARLHALSGELTASRRDLTSLSRRQARWNTYPSLVPPVLIAPELVGPDPDKARAEAEVMLREAHVWGTPRALGMALRANALVCHGDARVELLREASRILEPSRARIEYARVLVDLGAALRAGNHRAAARVPLRQALDIAHATGATLLGQRAGHELRAAGGRPRRPRTGGPESLTATERRTALMAAEGRSNPEIAQALFVTKKTVESHLASVFRKLDIHSRNQLEFALRTHSVAA